MPRIVNYLVPEHTYNLTMSSLKFTSFKLHLNLQIWIYDYFHVYTT